MIRVRLYLLIILTFLSGWSSAQLFDISTKDAAKLKDRTIIVVLQEERPEILNRIKKDPAKVERYKSLVAYTNNLLVNKAKRYLKSEKEIQFKKLNECLADTSDDYLVIDYSSLRINENTQLYLLKPDTTNLYGLRGELIRRKEIGFFELKFIEKIRGNALYTFYTPSSVPNEFDFITAFQFISGMLADEMNDPKFNSRDKELAIQQNNAKLANRTLIVDSAIVNKQWKSYNYIKEEYDSLSVYELSDLKSMVDKIKSDDSVYAYLNVVPYIDPIARGNSYLGTTGGSINDYEKVIYYMQLILDAQTGAILYYDKTEENTIVVKDWRRFQRYSRENTFKMPIQRITNPEQQKIYQQNQY